MKYTRKWIAFSLCLLLLVSLAGCGGKTKESTIEAYADQEIVLSGLTEDDITITPADLFELEMVTQKAEAPRSNGEIVSVTAVGPLLNTLLAEYGKKQSDFEQIRFTATDGYSIAYGSEILENRDVILMLADGDTPLDETRLPLVAIVPGERAMYWAKMIQRIDFEMEADAQSCEEIVFLEGAAKTLTQQSFEYQGSSDKAISTKELIGSFAEEPENGRLSLMASDGLKKSETMENFYKGLIKYTGKDSPRLVGDLPEGMQLHSMVLIGCGNTAFVSLPQLLQLAGKNDAIAFSDLLKQVSFISAKSYVITLEDGTAREFTQEALAKASFRIDDDSNAVLSISDGGDSLFSVLRVEAEK